MSAVFDALERDARRLVDMAHTLLSENTRLERDLKKLTDQLDDALDEVHRLRDQVRELQELAVSR